MSSRNLFFSGSIALLAVFLMPLAAQKALNPGYTRHQKAAYMEQNQVNFIRPGVVVKIVSAAIGMRNTANSTMAPQKNNFLEDMTYSFQTNLRNRARPDLPQARRYTLTRCLLRNTEEIRDRISLNTTVS